jgi:hypothetical protein
MVTVKFLKPHSSFSYFAGDIGEVTPESAAKLLAGGFIIPVPDEIKSEEFELKGPVNPLPEDLPARAVLFESGFTTILQIKEAGDSLLDAGISKATLKKVSKYIKDNYSFGE